MVLRHEPPRGHFELTGVTPGITPQEGSGICEFSVVIPALRREDLLSFNLQEFISPQNDTISVLGQEINIPSNVTLPTQDQNYIFPITISKPNYRNYFPSLGTKKVFAIHGQFPFNDVVDKMRNGSTFFDVINEFTMVNGSLVDATLSKPSQVLNIPVTQMTFSKSQKVKSPKIGSDETMLAAALGERGVFFFPTDVKNMASLSTTNLRVEGAPSSQAQWLAVLKKTDVNSPQNGVSAALQNFDGQVPTLLPILRNPKLLSLTHVQIQNVAVPTDLEALATYATLANLSPSGEEVPVWEVYVKSWSTDLQLPTWPGASEDFTPATQRWAVALLGAPLKTAVDLGPGLLQAVTHVTRSTVDF